MKGNVCTKFSITTTLFLQVENILNFSVSILTDQCSLYSGVNIKLIRTHEYSLPDHVAPHVQAVFNTVQFPIEIHGGPISGGPIISGGPQIRGGPHRAIN
jgi:hypothetical protein